MTEAGNLWQGTRHTKVSSSIMIKAKGFGFDHIMPIQRPSRVATHWHSTVITIPENLFCP